MTRNKFLLGTCAYTLILVKKSNVTSSAFKVGELPWGLRDKLLIFFAELEKNMYYHGRILFGV